jgi:hypothetical protein
VILVSYVVGRAVKEAKQANILDFKSMEVSFKMRLGLQTLN